MTIKELYMANCDWTEETKFIVLDRNSPRTLYEGVFFDMPSEIEDCKVATFRDNTIIAE